MDKVIHICNVALASGTLERGEGLGKEVESVGEVIDALQEHARGAGLQGFCRHLLLIVGAALEGSLCPLIDEFLGAVRVAATIVVAGSLGEIAGARRELVGRLHSHTGKVFDLRRCEDEKLTSSGTG